MTATVRQLLDSFDALSDADKHKVAVEILRRFGGAAEGDLPGTALVEAADDLFRALDADAGGLSVSKPTFASVTEQPCTCGFLEREADDPSSPIVFDTRLNEYHFEYPSPCAGGDCATAKAQLMIYHCPFCGGAAPPSKRAALFTAFTPEEQRRLYRLFDGMRALQEVIAALGPPDEDKERGLTVQQPGKGGQPPTTRCFRTFRYTRLSDTADVEVYADPAEDRVQVMLMGKYIGSSAKREGNGEENRTS